jgi:hypothetical protein
MLKFVRQKIFSYHFSDSQKASLSQRGFLFSLSAGFHKELNPLSGMTVNLPEVDAWLEEAVASVPGSFSPSALAGYFRDFLSEKARVASARLVSLQLHEERQGSWSWEFESDSFFYESSHFFECFHPEAPALCRLYFQWEQSAEEPVDLSRESLGILKASGLDSSVAIDETMNKLRHHLGDRRGKNSVLKRIRLESKDPHYVLVMERV